MWVAFVMLAPPLGLEPDRTSSKKFKGPVDL